MSSAGLEREKMNSGDREVKGDLAIFGGVPAFTAKLHVGRPNIGNREALLERIGRVLDTRWLSNAGPLEHEFEQRIATIAGVKHCIAMCNATVALEIAIRALDLKGEVIVPSFTFVATAHALQWQQITPVFCDIDPNTHNLDPSKIERMITPCTTGIIGVHLWGRPCKVDALTEIAQRHNIKLLFDSAHAFGCSTNGRMIGGFGDAEVFSFHATKFVNSGEGGAVVTDNDTLAHRIRLMRNFGFSGLDKVTSIGTNGKMNELSAAIGLTNLESIKEFTRANRANFETYQNNLAGIPGISLLSYDESQSPTYPYVVLDIDVRHTRLSRDQLLSVLHAENVLVRRYFYPGVHRMEPYSSHFPHASLLLPETELIAERVLVMPTGTTVNSRDIERICAILRTAVERSSEIQKVTAVSLP
jgi:dTDP-4-amino-4,6-dideoxygalactose transaminase